jgi:putative FmdB family regulatory protein
MPIYEYRCEKGHTFEVLQSMSDESLTTCEVCGAPVQKVLHAPAVHFKGSGFYTTDYGKKKSGANGGEKKEKSGSESSSSDSSSSTSSDSSSKPSSGDSKGSSESKPASKSSD